MNNANKAMIPINIGIILFCLLTEKNHPIKYSFLNKDGREKISV